MNNLDNKNNIEKQKALSDLFKEVQDIRYGRAQAQILEKDKKVKNNSEKKHSRKFKAVGVVVGSLFITLFFTIVHSNYIFATEAEEKVAIAEFEQNENPLNTMNIISSNISDVTSKEIITQEIQIPYETKYVDNQYLPKGEEKIVQTGTFGYIDQTIIKTYDSTGIIDEKLINEVVKNEAVEQIIERGTSEFLANKKAHLEDTLYTTQDVTLHANASAESAAICTIYQYVDVTLKYESNNWCIVTVDGMEGYVNGDYLTSETLTPGSAERARIKRIEITLKPDMAINKPSGFTRADFVKVLSGHSEDENHIFEDNAGLFYDIEKKYNINGIFLASIGIHESNWGRSNISKQKKNLFGYGAYDSAPSESSYIFESYQYGIELLAKVLSKYYINEPGTAIYDGETAVGTYYNGPTVSGVNVRYASDTNWANRVYSIMESLYGEL